MRRRTLIFFIFFLGLFTTQAYSFWIWTPQTKKWVNPKAQARSTPGEQFDFAKNLYDIKKYQESENEFKRLLKTFPKSVEAAESQYYLGLIKEEQKNLYEAFQAYQKVIDKYPFFEKIPQIIEREYKIGEAFMSGKKRKVGGVAMPVDNPAIEIFAKVVENSTYGPFAPSAQYKLGLVLKSLLRYYEAEEAFNKVISNYPDSEWASAARFQLASCRAAVSKGADYDQGAAKEAKEQFEEFIRDHPDAVLSRQAQENIDQLSEKEAESKFNIGRFYEKQKEYEAAKIYYNEVINSYPQSSFAIKSLERLQILEKRK